MKKLISLGLFFSLSLFLFGALNAAAAETGSCMQGDSDHNGVLTCSEAKNLASERFTAMDTNGDNRLSMDEMEAGMTGIFKAMDSNGDGKVTVQEYVSYWCGTTNRTVKASGRRNSQPQFRKMDTNGDGVVSPGECVALWTVRFRDADENRDGILTVQEYTQSLIIWFADMDPNRDSLVTRREWNNYWIGKCR